MMKCQRSNRPPPIFPEVVLKLEVGDDRSDKDVGQWMFSTPRISPLHRRCISHCQRFNQTIFEHISFGDIHGVDATDYVWRRNSTFHSLDDVSIPVVCSSDTWDVTRENSNYPGLGRIRKCLRIRSIRMLLRGLRHAPTASKYPPPPFSPLHTSTMQPLLSTRPTHAQLTAFLSGFFPVRQKDVPFVYHTPRHPHYDPSTAPLSHIVLSITPTQGVYDAINQRNAPTSPLCFLHRPFLLDRRRLRRGAVVLSSHVGFDEVLTVGWNTVLAQRLGVDVDNSLCVQGYKGDPDRRIGIVGRLEIPLDTLVRNIRQEFNGVGELYAARSDGVSVLAIMNAFHGDEVERVLRMARERQWIDEAQGGEGVIYLTGQPRESGMEAARKEGVSVLCVGHRAAEEWGVRFLASQTRDAFPALQVEEIYEDEEIPERPKKALKTEPRLQSLDRVE